jgi:hypothetical protein
MGLRRRVVCAGECHTSCGRVLCKWLSASAWGFARSGSLHQRALLFPSVAVSSVLQLVHLHLALFWGDLVTDVLKQERESAFLFKLFSFQCPVSQALCMHICLTYVARPSPMVFEASLHRTNARTFDRRCICRMRQVDLNSGG